MRTLFDYGDGAQRWALVQTNHDHWLVDPVPASDGGFGADRAGPAMSRMGLARPGLMMPRTPGEKVAPRTPRTTGNLCDCRGEMSVERMWQIIGSLPNFQVLGRSVLSAVMVPAAGSCEVRYQVGIGAGDECKCSRSLCVFFRRRLQKKAARRQVPVSYTHLTLPTIYSV